MENYPKVTFIYSSVYDVKWRRGELGSKRRDAFYPAAEKILDYIREVEKKWRREERKVMVEISRTASLGWAEEKIDCFVVGRCRAFSFPTTLQIYEGDYQRFIDILTHELIHRIFSSKDNKKRAKRAWNYFNKKYSEESRTTRVHVVVYAVHTHLYKKFSREHRIEENAKRVEHKPDYRRAWEIVKRDGYETIIEELKNNIE
jgi:hypothetical protein